MSPSSSSHKSKIKLPFQKKTPLFQQLHNTCGLASILMGVLQELDSEMIESYLNFRNYYNKEEEDFGYLKNLDMKQSNNIQKIINYGEKAFQFIEEIANLLDPMIKEIENIINEPLRILPEFKLQYAIEYLLLKAQGSGEHYQDLVRYLETRFQSYYHDQKTLFQYILTTKREKYMSITDVEALQIVKAYDEYILDGDIINPYLLEDETHSMKTDIELKLLLEILGYKFISVNSGDGTGSLYFTQKNAWENIKILLSAIIDPKKIVLIGKEEHWMVVTGFSLTGKKMEKYYEVSKIIKRPPRDFTIFYNDPILPSSEELQLKGISDKVRFYIFKHRGENLSWLWNDILKQIEKDIKLESLISIEIEDNIRYNKNGYNKTGQISNLEHSNIIINAIEPTNIEKNDYETVKIKERKNKIGKNYSSNNPLNKSLNDNSESINVPITQNTQMQQLHIPIPSKPIKIDFQKYSDLDKKKAEKIRTEFLKLSKKKVRDFDENDIFDE